MGDYSDFYDNLEHESYDAPHNGHYEATATRCRTREAYFNLYPEEEHKERYGVAYYVEDQEF